MKLKCLFSAFLLFCLCACQSREPQMVIIDSNVSAFIYQGDKRIGETPFAGKLPRSEIGSLSLKRSGYKTVKLPVKKVYGRSTPSITSLYTDITSSKGVAEDASGEDILAMTTLIPSLPLFIMIEATYFVGGVWIEYMPNSFYIEMVPTGKKTASADFLRRIQIKNFALKLYPDMAAGNPETLSAFAGLAQHDPEYIANLLSKKTDPVSFAEAAVAGL
ncbi:MAG: hypothetical protein IJY17_04915 [Alphaproteobacteria bacterium]|nr:hypothetical protein [Alphaproteobacteria bacterium]